MSSLYVQIIAQNDFHSNPFSGFRHTPSRKSPLLLAISLRPELHHLYHYSNELSICDTFDDTHAPCIIDTLHIIRSVFKPQFIHYTKYAKYVFLLFYLYLNKCCIVSSRKRITYRRLKPIYFYCIELVT